MFLCVAVCRSVLQCIVVCCNLLLLCNVVPQLISLAA